MDSYRKIVSSIHPQIIQSLMKPYSHRTKKKADYSLPIGPGGPGGPRSPGSPYCWCSLFNVVNKWDCIRNTHFTRTDKEIKIKIYYYFINNLSKQKQERILFRRKNREENRIFFAKNLNIEHTENERVQYIIKEKSGNKVSPSKVIKNIQKSLRPPHIGIIVIAYYHDYLYI